MNAEAPTRRRVLTLVAWSAIAVPTAAWAVHLVFTAAFAGYGGRGRAGTAPCQVGPEWPMHLATAVTALLCVAGAVAAHAVYRQHDGSGSGSLGGQYRLLGLLGYASAAFNLVLILIEGSYVIFLGHCG
jgi:hypothetical protein